MWRYNSDGIDLFNSCYVRIADCFLRDFDDCVALKAVGGWDKYNVHHVSVTGCTIWCDWGRSLELGAETCADEYYDILWEDCDLIHSTHIHMDLQNSDWAWIHDMLVRNIRCEYSRHDLIPVYQKDMAAPYTDYDTPWHPVLIASPVYDGPYSQVSGMGRTSNVRFEKIQILCPDVPDILSGEREQSPVRVEEWKVRDRETEVDLDTILKFATAEVKRAKDRTLPSCEFVGGDAEHCNSDIVIDCVTVNGIKIKPEELPLVMGRYDRNIIVK